MGAEGSGSWMSTVGCSWPPSSRRSEAWELPQDANAGANQHQEMLLAASALLTLILIGQDTKVRLPGSPPAAWTAGCLSVCLSGCGLS